MSSGPAVAAVLGSSVEGATGHPVVAGEGVVAAVEAIGEGIPPAVAVRAVAALALIGAGYILRLPTRRP